MTGTDHLALAMQRAVPLIERMVLVMSGLLGIGRDELPERISRETHSKITRLLRPVEALLRRLIILMARDVDMAAVTPRVVRKSALRRRKPASATAHFRLFEPLSHLTSVRRGAPARQRGNGPRCFDLSQPFPALPEVPQDKAAAPLFHRIEAVQRALENSSRLARRYAGFLARARQPKAVPGRFCAMRPGPAPGARSAYTPPDLRDLLAFFTAEVRRGPP